MHNVPHLSVLIIPAILASLPLSLAAQTADSLHVSANGQTATASFTRGTPCTPYALAWGDGTEVVEQPEAEACIQVLDEVALTHAYQEPGTYTVTLALGGSTSTAVVSLTQPAMFDLEDIASVTAEWVDPSPLMADEEYYVYTINLKNGETVTAKVAGFTTEEFREEQFRNVGYTGDVAALIALADQSAIPAEPESTDRQTLVEQLIAVLQELIRRFSAQ